MWTVFQFFKFPLIHSLNNQVKLPFSKRGKICSGYSTVVVHTLASRACRATCPLRATSPSRPSCPSRPSLSIIGAIAFISARLFYFSLTHFYVTTVGQIKSLYILFAFCLFVVISTDFSIEG